MEEDFLKYGDEIVLYNDGIYGYLTSQSFSSKEIYVQQCSKVHDSNVFNARDMVFRVTPQLSYDAFRLWRRNQKQLKARNENPSMEEMTLDEIKIQKLKEEALKKRIKINLSNNIDTIDKSFGKQVMYGQPIQLMHLDSGFFLQHAKKVSELHKGCQLLELTMDPAPSRVTFIINSRYNYRAVGDPVVFGDHILLHNEKYNQFLNCSEDIAIDQSPILDLQSEFRPPSPLRKPHPTTYFRRFEANMSPNFSKWQVINYRQYKSQNEHLRLLYSGDVISLKHAETAGLLCYDEQSEKRPGNPVYVRIFKGQEVMENLTTHSLFEVQIHNLQYNETFNQLGYRLMWQKQKLGKLTQLVRFRHFNSGKLLTVKPLYKQDDGNSQRTSQRKSNRASNSRADRIEKYILCLGENMEPQEINRRIDRISEILQKKEQELDFNQQTDPDIQELNRSVGLDQVFEIENTIIEPVLKIKNKCVVKMKNLAYNLYISTDIKRLDGEADEIEDQEGGDDNLLVNQTELGGGGFADDTGTRTGQPGEATGESPVINMDEIGGGDLGGGGQENFEREEAEAQAAEGDEAEEEAEMVEEEDDEALYQNKFAKTMQDVSDSMIYNGIKMINQASMDDVFILDKFDASEVKANLFLQSCVPLIKEFIYVTRVKSNDLRGPYMKGFEELLGKILFFLIQIENTEGQDPFKCEGVPSKQRQKYFRELRIIDLLVDILIYEFEGDTSPFNLDNITQRSPITRICQLIYRILKMCAKDNELNKFYVAQWISHFFDQSMSTQEENDINSEATITELLNNNKTLLDKQINTATIRNIVKICSDSQKNDRFIVLLSSLCSCNGEAILSNQDDICELLLEDDEFQHLLIKIARVGDAYCPIFEDQECLDWDGDPQKGKGHPIQVDITKMRQYMIDYKWTRLYYYFENIINLASLMCLSRNYAGIKKMVNHYTLEFVMSTFLDTRVTDRLRSYFGRLLLSLHIDKDPMDPVNVPNLTRVWNDVKDAKLQIQTSREPIKGLLTKLKEFAVQFFESMQGTQRSWENEQNLLTMEVLNIVEKMIILGFYNNETELLLVIEPIISLLDGSNDFTSPEEEKLFNVELQKIEEEKQMRKLRGQSGPLENKITRDKQLRYANNENNRMIITIKKKIVQILSRVMLIQNDIRLTKFLMEFNTSDEKLIQDPNRAGPEFIYLDEINNNKELTQGSEMRDSCDDKSMHWMRMAFHNKNLDLRVQSKQKDLTCILLDIVLYQDSKLVNSAFTLLTQYYCQKQQIIKYSSQVQILQEEQEVAILKKVSNDIIEMKREAGLSEFWMGVGSDRDQLKRARWFIEKLEMLTDLCVWVENRVIDLDEKKKKNEDEDDDDQKEQDDQFEFLNLSELVQEWDNEDPKVCTDEEQNDEQKQILLRNLNSYEIAIQIIQAQRLEQVEDKNCYLKVLEKAYIFLIKFVRNNKANQFILKDYLDLFIEDIEYGVHSWELIAEIFRNSELLITYNVYPHLKKVIKLIDSLPKETQKKTTMLSFLTYFMKLDGQALKELQTFICMEVTSVIRKNCDHLFVNDLGLKDLHLYILEMKNAYQEFMHDERYLQEMQIPPELSYTIEYIKLLAVAGEGKNAATESRAQEKLPIQDILANMKLADFCYPLKNAIVYFMDSIYFDIEKDVSDDNINKMFDFITEISKDMANFVEIQNRMKQMQGQKQTKTKKVNTDEEKDLDEIEVDINKNFTMLTSFGSFEVLYLIERYIYEVVFQALTHYFNLRLPIKQVQQDFFRTFLDQIKKAMTFVSKDIHKQKALELQKVIKKIPQLKELGADQMSQKGLVDSDADKKKAQGQGLNFPVLNQAQKLNGYMKSLQINDKLQIEYEKEFEDLVSYITQISNKSEDAFNGINTIQVEEILQALIKISDIPSDIDKSLRIVCLKIIRKTIEMERRNSKDTKPASQWETDDWSNFRTEIRQKQMMLINLKVIPLVCNLISYEPKLSIKEEALQVAIAILLGGNNRSQMEFNDYIINDEQNQFFQNLKNIVFESFDMIKKTQTKRNAGKQKLISIQQRVEEIEAMDSHTKIKALRDELKKLNLEKQILEDDLKDTEFDEDENPAMYTTDQLTVARSINDMYLCMKIMQLFCENHNPTLQDTLREQFNSDGKLKNNTIDFITTYSKIYEGFQKIFNNNTAIIGHQLIDTLTESVQGPCKGNQRAMVQAKIFDSSREYISGYETEIDHLGFTDEEDLDSLQEYKQKVVCLLVSLLEGEVDMEIMNRMAFSLDMNVIKQRLLKVFEDFACDLLGMESINMKDFQTVRLNKNLKKESFDGNINECFQIYILMHSLADAIPEQQEILMRENFTGDQWKAFEFIRQHIARIEVVVNGKLQRVYFPIRPVCNYMSLAYKARLMEEVDRDSQATKVQGLMDFVPDLMDEMYHNEELTRATIEITPSRLMALKDFSSIVGLCINTLYLSFATQEYHYKDLQIDDWVTDSIGYLGYVQGASSGLLIFLYAINKKNLITKQKWREFCEQNKEEGEMELIENNSRFTVEEMPIQMTHMILMLKGPEANEFNIGDGPNFGNYFTMLEVKIFNIYFFIQDAQFQYQVLYFGISILGYMSQDIYYSFHLLDVITRSPTLQNVIRSVTSNAEQLSLTLLLLGIIIYIFTMITFFYIQDNMYDWGVNAYDSDIVGENNCMSMFQCFVTMIDKGLRFGGGIGDITEPIHFNNMREHYFVKLAHDASFHIIVKVIMLNVLFGIIIDTFAQLRDEKQKNYDDMVKKCFICNLGQLIFQKYCPDGGMAKHIDKDHKLWNYAFYMVHLYTLDISDHNGVESYVFACFEQNDITWMPAYRALCIEEVGGSVIEDGGGDGDGGPPEPEEEEIDVDALFIECNKYIIQINKQLDSLLEKRKHQMELMEKKRKLTAQQSNSQILSGEIDRSALQ